MSTVYLKTCFNLCFIDNPFAQRPVKFHTLLKPRSYSFSSNSKLALETFCNFNKSNPHYYLQQSNLFHPTVRVASTDAATIESFQSTDVLFKETFPLKRTEKVEGRIFVRLDRGKDSLWELTVGNSLPGKWILHWGVSYINDVGSEWDQPPMEMRPPGSVAIKDYAVETPLTETSSSLEGGTFQEVKIGFSLTSQIAAIYFVLKDEETGAWYQHRGRDFKVPLVDFIQEDANAVGPRKRFDILPGALGQISNCLPKTEAADDKVQDDNIVSNDVNQQNRSLKAFCEELPVTKEVLIDHSTSISVKKCTETAKYLLNLDTDLPGDVVVHWGVSKGDSRKWEIPPAPYPPETVVFKDKALRTQLKPRDGIEGRWAVFTIEEVYSGFSFVVKLDDGTWLKNMGDDFYIPFSSSSKKLDETSSELEGTQTLRNTGEGSEGSSVSEYTEGIINEIRNLVTGISSVKNQSRKTVEAQESILQEIEKLAAEAYSIFRSSVPTFSEEGVEQIEKLVQPSKISSGTGTGFEILCQGFNWESHKSGRWYVELKEKAATLASYGFSVIWLPPPTESVSPEGYMPKDLYNLNSRYGNIDQLKDLVKSLHDLGIKVLGDVVLNHRCAHYKNQNGVWNIFGGRLNWDDRAVVADDPHFQGRGNKSSGDNFHAAPNIDHSQEFVRKDLEEWLRWLRQEIGYDGWRLDFVRGFWGGYVKDYLDATEPYFAVGEFWDSLSYTYNEMDYNQDAHRQRIVDWINATSGTAGAFDVTTKGILHTALERCEYWRLSDEKGKPPGVVGWWPSRAVTFIENHDTGSTQGHWRFPSGKEIQGYAYILTHPGTPSVFYDHLFSHYQSQITSLISLRRRNKIHCRSEVQIAKAERDVYAAIIDNKVTMKIGPGHFNPPSGSQNWSVAAEGPDYKIWEAL